MESQIIFTDSLYRTPPIPCYTSYHTPPYTSNGSSWHETVYQPFSMNQDVLQMQQQLRFPTPPITPPRGYNNTIVESSYAEPLPQLAENKNKTQQHRTQSVIMKIENGQNPQYLPADLPYDTFTEDTKHTHPVLQEQYHHSYEYHDEPQLQSQNDTASSGTLSPSSQNEFICDWIDCGRYFQSLELLAHHVTLMHAVASLSDGLYYCRWTGCQRTERGFNARYKMLVHVRTHTKEKPHQCHLCEKRFSRAENLKIHIRSHSGEKPYACTFAGCNKAYSNSSDRFKHTRTHSMEKPYMCKVAGCQKRYTDPSSLRKHVKTFKHSVQILDLKAAANNQQQTISKNSDEQLPRYPPNEPINKYKSCLMLNKESLAVTNPDSFCIAMEEMCHIKATFNCYAVVSSAPADVEPSWLRVEPETNDIRYHHPATYRHVEGYAMHLNFGADMPLDLRIKRS